jgi:hypothetical protein
MDKNMGIKNCHLCGLFKMVLVRLLQNSEHLGCSNTSQLFGRRQKVGYPAPRKFFRPQLSLKIFLHRRHARQGVLRKYSGTDKRTLLKKYFMLWCTVKRGGTVRGALLQEKLLFLNFWSQVLIWDRP